MSLDSFKGFTIVFHIWATWCAPCVKEVPSLDRLAARLDRNKAIVVAVSQDKGGAAIARPFLEGLGVRNLSANSDPGGKLSRDLGVRT
jgi:thiol-disulfide isomerase/thioredoxin